MTVYISSYKFIWTIFDLTNCKFDEIVVSEVVHSFGHQYTTYAREENETLRHELDKTREEMQLELEQAEDSSRVGTTCNDARGLRTCTNDVVALRGDVRSALVVCLGATSADNDQGEATMEHDQR